jgi:hypothetical protein
MDRVERTLSRNPVKNESIVEIGLKWLMENDVLARSRRKTIGRSVVLEHDLERFRVP